MAGDTVITIVGNLTADPELRFTPSGAAVCNFTVASTPRSFDKASGEWKDGDALFLRCSIWRQPAEHVAESLTRGMRVIVQGPAAAAELREGRREAHRHRARGRRDRAVAAVRHREGREGRPGRRRASGGAGFIRSRRSVGIRSGWR